MADNQQIVTGWVAAWTFSFNSFIEKSFTFYTTSAFNVHHSVASRIFTEGGETPRIIITKCLPLNDTGKKKKTLLVTGITVNYTY